MMNAETVTGKLDYQAEDIASKSIVVTGGTTGIGRATALLLAAHGANVVICGRHSEEMEDALGDMHGLPGTVCGVVADMADASGVRTLFDEADRRLSGLDVFINNAALGAGSVTEGTYSEWEYIIRTNLLGYMACCHEAYVRMKKNGGGHIVNIGSMSADVREAESDVYVATKSGIQGFTESFRKVVNGDGIKVSLIEPGAVGTDMPGDSPRAQRRQQEKGEALKAEDIAACVYYCLTQPARCDVVSVQVRPHRQEI